MEVVKTVEEMRNTTLEARESSRLVGLVPTMGFFHEGHLELMKLAARECDVVVVTLFVNPVQFGPSEDFEDYPRDFERDRRLAEGVGVDYIFAPDAEQMYPPGFETSVEVGDLENIMCGASRPGHFRGVTTVVAKLFNIVPAHRAYFGQKDAQQLVIIRRMAKDLDFGIEIVGVPTVREDDGLAMSSRNCYLNPEERRAATALYRSLERAGALIDSGERNANALMDAVREVVCAEPLVNLEYIVICDNIYLKPLKELYGEVLIALAARVGGARLIDNMIFSI